RQPAYHRLCFKNHRLSHKLTFPILHAGITLQHAGFADPDWHFVSVASIRMMFSQALPHIGTSKICFGVSPMNR
ncbi:hypothetical protein HAX54_043804, partial [Datura stramonium]|nr:hypothetical protein [Datura stramonium]